MLSVRTKIGLILALILLTVLMSIFNGCTATHAQFTFGTGKEGTSAAAAMAAREPWPAGPGEMSSKSEKSVSRVARD